MGGVGSANSSQGLVPILRDRTVSLSDKSLCPAEVTLPAGPESQHIQTCRVSVMDRCLCSAATLQPTATCDFCVRACQTHAQVATFFVPVVLWMLCTLAPPGLSYLAGWAICLGHLLLSKTEEATIGHEKGCGSDCKSSAPLISER